MPDTSFSFRSLTFFNETMRSLGVSSLRDTLSSRRHSRDFAYARGDYLRSRVMIVGLIFLVLSPFWTIIDSFMLPDAARGYAWLGRAIMVAGLLATVVLAWRSSGRVYQTQICAGLLIALPALFYGLVLLGMPPDWNGRLIGYSFIPFMLMVMLGIFPFTLVESAIFGVGLLLLEGYALHMGGVLLTAEGLQEIWLLAALMCITLTSNYFHLGLLLRLYREATHDPLTGLLNRGALHQRLEQVRGGRQSQAMAMLMMDLDHFKRVNDQYGHAVGDIVLRQFAQLLRAAIGPGDFAARYGGEEFVAVLVDTSKEKAIALAERLRQQVEETPVTAHDGTVVRFTTSIGVATLHSGEPFDSAARRADDRLYEAKKTSRNCVVGV